MCRMQRSRFFTVPFACIAAKLTKLALLLTCRVTICLRIFMNALIFFQRDVLFASLSLYVHYLYMCNRTFLTMHVSLCGSQHISVHVLPARNVLQRHGILVAEVRICSLPATVCICMPVQCKCAVTFIKDRLCIPLEKIVAQFVFNWTNMFSLAVAPVRKVTGAVGGQGHR
jgi:hypothetical protein